MKRLVAGLVVVVFLAFMAGASARNNEMPITWEKGHLGMDLGDPGEQVVYMVVHGHECIVVGDAQTAGGEGGFGVTLAVSCDWSNR